MRGLRAWAALILAVAAASGPVAAAGVRDIALLRADGRQISFRVEVATTTRELSRGLMFCENLPPDRGMLFDFGRDDVRPKMWMHDVPIALDMLFVAGDGTIRAVHENARPGDDTVIASPVPVRAVLELAGGAVRVHRIAPGDRIVGAGFGPDP